MKFLTAQITLFLESKPDRKNLRLLFNFLLVLLAIITIFSVIFHFIMEREGQSFSWMTGFYWTLTVMSTLGFGDITFNSDLGRFFSIVVLLSGMLFLLVLFPFTFINFFYSPWMKAQAQARVPRELPSNMKGHVILTRYGPVTEALIKKLDRFKYQYIVLVSDLTEGLQLKEKGVNVMVGDLIDPNTYKNARVENAALVATTESDVLNTNVAFIVRGISKEVTIISTSNTKDAVDIMQLAGSNNVLQLGEMMGLILSRRANAGDACAHVVGRFGDLQIAEALVTGSSLVGQSLKESALRQKVGVSVVGLWERGNFQTARPETIINQSTVLVLAGSGQEIELYNNTFGVKGEVNVPVVILGGGRVGRATARALSARNLNYRIVEKEAARVKNIQHAIIGDASDIEVLEEAGIRDSPCVIITTHDDDVNVYLTIYCRLIRPDIQIITRSTLDRNLGNMHRAGADFVISYASLGANTVLNLLQRSDIMMVAEGLDLIKAKIPKQLAGKTIAETSIRKDTGCTIIAIRVGEEISINPEPTLVLPDDGEIILIGTVEAENLFFEIYGSN